MLLPTQQAAGVYLTDFMRSMLRDIEERREEEQKKAQGKQDDKQDKAIQAKIRPDESAAAANARINAHFFGALKPDGNPMATLISNFANALGVAQADGESAGDFADRLQDALMMAGLAQSYANGQALPITLKTLNVTENQVKTIMEGQRSADDDPYAVLAARIGLNAGVDTKADDFAAQMEKALTAARAQYPKSVEAVEERSGLRKLGVTAAELIEAVRRPWGDAAMKIKSALDDQAATEKTLNNDTRKVLQRLKDAADPKTSAELKAERGRDDPTRVEDAETHAERERDIQTREAQEKVEDVKKRQDAIGERLRNESTDADAAAPGGAVDPMQFIQVLAAGAETAKTAESAEAGGTAAPEAGTDAADDGDPTTLSRDEQMFIVANHTPEAGMQARADASQTTLAVSVDDIGLYRLIGKEKKAA